MNRRCGKGASARSEALVRGYWPPEAMEEAEPLSARVGVDGTEACTAMLLPPSCPRCGVGEAEAAGDGEAPRVRRGTLVTIASIGSADDGGSEDGDGRRKAAGSVLSHSSLLIAKA